MNYNRPRTREQMINEADDHEAVRQELKATEEALDDYDNTLMDRVDVQLDRAERAANDMMTYGDLLQEIIDKSRAMVREFSRSSDIKQRRLVEFTIKLSLLELDVINEMSEALVRYGRTLEEQRRRMDGG